MRTSQSFGVNFTIKKEKAKSGIASVYVGVSEICYTLFRGKLTTYFAGKEMQQMLSQHKTKIAYLPFFN